MRISNAQFISNVGSYIYLPLKREIYFFKGSLDTSDVGIHFETVQIQGSLMPRHVISLAVDEL